MHGRSRKGRKKVETKELRIGIVGTSMIAHKFADAARKSRLCTPIAVYSRGASSGAAFAAAEGGLRVETDYRALLSMSELDAVYIASPNALHYGQAMAALRAGKHVLCEKPTVSTLSEFRSLASEAERRGLVLMEAMRPLHDPALETIRSAIGRLGRLRRVDLEYCQYSSRYDRFLSGEVLNAFDPSLSNAAVMDIGVYPIALLVALLGLPESVRSESLFLHNGFEGAGNISLDYGDKQVGVVYSKISDSVNPSVIEGERGSLTIDKISAPTRVTLHPRGESPVTLPLSSIGNNMLYEVEAFAAMVRGESGAEPYLNISLETLAVVEKAYSQTGAAEKM